jgi:hypothetical protein
MFRTDGSNNVGSRPAPAAIGTPGYFKDTSSPGTQVTADWANAVQEEIAGACEAAGLTLSKTNVAQLEAAIRRLSRPLVALTGDYTLVYADGEVTFAYDQATDATLTLPDFADAPLENGTKIRLIVTEGGGVMTVTSTGTISWYPSGAHGDVVVGTHGVLDATKLSANEWIVTGVGIT